MPGLLTQRNPFSINQNHPNKQKLCFKYPFPGLESLGVLLCLGQCHRVQQTESFLFSQLWNLEDENPGASRVRPGAMSYLIADDFLGLPYFPFSYNDTSYVGFELHPVT